MDTRLHTETPVSRATAFAIRDAAHAAMAGTCTEISDSSFAGLPADQYHVWVDIPDGQDQHRDEMLSAFPALKIFAAW